MLVSPRRNQISSWTIDLRCSRLVVTSGKPLREIEANLPAEQRAHAGAGAVALDRAVVERFAHQIEIGAHRVRSFQRLAVASLYTNSRRSARRRARVAQLSAG